MRPALLWLNSKRTQEGLWRLEHVHAGAVHFELEEVGKPSRFITRMALVVLDHYGRDIPNTLDSPLA
jgi:hypothetical protein